MTFISMQNDFLPTDTVVTPPEILNHIPELSNLGIIGLCIAIVGFGGLVVSFSGLMYDEPFKKTALVGVLFLGVGATIAAVENHSLSKEQEAVQAAKTDYSKQVEEQSAKNYANLVANIEAVYSIEKVEMNAEAVEMLTTADEAKRADDETLESPSLDNVEVVVIQDGLAYEALLSQDPETYEPTLSVRVTASVVAEPLRKK